MRTFANTMLGEVPPVMKFMIKEMIPAQRPVKRRPLGKMSRQRNLILDVGRAIIGVIVNRLMTADIFILRQSYLKSNDWMRPHRICEWGGGILPNGLRRLRRAAADAKQQRKQEDATFGFVWRKSPCSRQCRSKGNFKLKFMYSNNKENRRFLLDFLAWLARYENYQSESMITLVDNFLNPKEPEAVHGNEAEKVVCEKCSNNMDKVEGYENWLCPNCGWHC